MEGDTSSSNRKGKRGFRRNGGCEAKKRDSSSGNTVEG
jgi:hypothetical protein